MFDLPLDISIWIGIGILLVVLEFIIPGAILSFLGIAAFIVAFCLYNGIIVGAIHALILWFITSLVLVFILRTWVLRFMPAEFHIDETDEELIVKGKIVDVLTDISKDNEGRISLSDTQWTAHSEDTILSGEKALIIGRLGNGFLVEKIK